MRLTYTADPFKSKIQTKTSNLNVKIVHKNKSGGVFEKKSIRGSTVKINIYSRLINARKCTKLI